MSFFCSYYHDFSNYCLFWSPLYCKANLLTMVVRCSSGYDSKILKTVFEAPDRNDWIWSWDNDIRPSPIRISMEIRHTWYFDCRIFVLRVRFKMTIIVTSSAIKTAGCVFFLYDFFLAKQLGYWKTDDIWVTGTWEKHVATPYFLEFSHGFLGASKYVFFHFFFFDFEDSEPQDLEPHSKHQRQARSTNFIEQWKKHPRQIGLYKGFNPTQLYKNYNKTIKIIPMKHFFLMAQ